MFDMPIRTPITIALGLVLAIWFVSSAFATVERPVYGKGPITLSSADGPHVVQWSVVPSN